jgi:prepilin peptidase CpaA
MASVSQFTAPAVVLFVAIVATVCDLRTRRIPNLLTLPTAVGGIAVAALGASTVSRDGALVGLMVGLVLMLPGYLLGSTGAGDVKLMAALGAWLGPSLAVVAFLLTAIAGGVLALATAAARGRAAPALTGTARLVTAPGRARAFCTEREASHRFAYGPSIAVGASLALWWS